MTRFVKQNCRLMFILIKLNSFMQYTVTKAMKKYKWMHATRKKDPNEISPELTFPQILNFQKTYNHTVVYTD